MKFTDLNLPAEIQSVLDEINFVEATDIQAKTLQTLLQQKDLIACSQTGSGKTAAYSIPLAKRLAEDDQHQAMILAPTRELADQISDFVEKVTKKLDKVSVVLLVGGQDIRKQFKKLQRKPRLIVATPGRLIDHLKRNTVQIHKVSTLIVDEGDRMIDMGFAPQLKQILKFLPEERHTSFFTATMDKKVLQLANSYLKNPEQIIIKNSVPVEKINQSAMRVEQNQKDDVVLDRITQKEGPVIVFTRTKRGSDKLKRFLVDFGVKAESLHGGKTQGQRNRAISGFKNSKIKVLCATDVAARGLDVPNIDMVINYDLPTNEEDYVHRIGRTGRNGAGGEAVTLVSSSELRAWNDLATKYHIKGFHFKVEKVTKKAGGKKSGGKQWGRKRRDDNPRDARDGEDKQWGRKRRDDSPRSGRDGEDNQWGRKKKRKTSGKKTSKSFGKKAGKSSGKRFGKTSGKSSRKFQSASR